MTWPLAAAALMLLAPCAFGGAPSTATVHLASFRRTHYTLELALIDPFERLLRDSGSELLEVETLESHFKGRDYLYQVPPRDPGLAAARGGGDGDGSGEEVTVFETVGGFLLMDPRLPGLEERFLALARDPASYRNGVRPILRPRKGRLTRTWMPDGTAIHSLEVGGGLPGEAHWRSTVAVLYRAVFNGEEFEAVLLYKALGGEGRTAAGLDLLRARHGSDLLVLNRGEIFVYGASVTTGTLAGYRFEKMGVRAAAAGSGELSRLEDLFDYRATRSPDEGVVFLSANLVHSEGAPRPVLPPFHVFKLRGVRVGVFGLTNPRWAGFLSPEHAAKYRLHNPLSAATAAVEALRGSADIVIALSNLGAEDNARLRRSVRGIDIIVGDSFPFETGTALPGAAVVDLERGRYDEALTVTGDWPTVLTHVELERTSLEDRRYALTAREDHILLDETLPDTEGFVKFRPEAYGVTEDTGPALLPSARRLYGDEAEGRSGLRARDFWNLASSLTAGRASAEAAFLPVFPVHRRTVGDHPESLVREWFQFKDRVQVFELSGAALRSLVSEVRRQESPGAELVPGRLQLSLGGVGQGDTLHGVPIDPKSVYRVAATDRVLARTSQFPALAGAQRKRELGVLGPLVLSELRKLAARGTSIESYRGLMRGRPLIAGGLWKINFRDISVNASNTKIVSDPAFGSVSNARVNGFDELLVGGTAKVDLEYYRAPYKWVNSAEVEYSRSRLRPPGQPVILNTPQNRTSYLSVGTVRVGSFPLQWAGRSFGPSLGAQYEGHVERLPDTRRKHVFSLYPGVELFDGSFVRTISISANLRRDFTPATPLNNYGIRARALFSRALGGGVLQGEVRTNYFIRSSKDTAQDLRMELNALAKYHLPVWKHMTLAPFLDYYYFVLKVRPVTGYNTIIGISLSFSRLWKPQYESF